MFDQEYRPASAKTATEVCREAAEEAPLSGTVLLDDDLDAAVGGRAPIGEEIPQ
jgi:hypothetical protein